MLLLLAGAGCALTARKRKFDRTNAFGIERHGSFWAKLTNRTGDTALVALAICGSGAGTILLAVNHLDTWGWLVMAPVCLFMLYLLVGL
ncbi:MAG: hypothetical protein ABJA94_11235 [Rhodoglobus sp.]